jgi:hypothetical protein
VVGLGDYNRAADLIPIRKPSTGNGIWYGCESNNNPYPCVTGGG